MRPKRCIKHAVVWTKNYHTQSRRLHKMFCFHKGRGKWQFVEDRKGTKAVPLPLLCASFFSQKKGQSPALAGAAEKYFGQLITTCPQKAAGLLNSNALNMQFVAQVPRRIPLQAMVFPILIKQQFCRSSRDGLILSSEKKVCKDSHKEPTWFLMNPPRIKKQ